MGLTYFHNFSYSKESLSHNTENSECSECWCPFCRTWRERAVFFPRKQVSREKGKKDEKRLPKRKCDYTSKIHVLWWIRQMDLVSLQLRQWEKLRNHLVSTSAIWECNEKCMFWKAMHTYKNNIFFSDAYAIRYVFLYIYIYKCRPIQNSLVLPPLYSSPCHRLDVGPFSWSSVAIPVYSCAWLRYRSMCSAYLETFNEKIFYPTRQMSLS